MAASASLIIFIIVLLLVAVGLIVLTFYMNSWLCFSKVPKIWFFDREYEPLESAPVSEYEESEKSSITKKEASVLDEVDKEDADTIAATEVGLGVDGADDDRFSDISDEKIKMFGQITATFNHQMTNNTLTINIIRVDRLANKSEGGPSEYEICIAIFDDHNNKLTKSWKSPRFSIPQTSNNLNVQFQKFEYPDISQKDLSQTAVRFRLYGCERKHRQSLLGESILGLGNIKFHENRPPYNIQLERRAVDKKILPSKDQESLDKEFTRNVSIHVENSGELNSELFIGMGYNPITGRLTVEIIKGNSFFKPDSKEANKMPNSFVKITLSVNNSQEIEKTKTTVRRNQANPLFKEKFMFHLPQFQLEDVTLMIAVYHRKSMSKKELIGWFSLGNHNSGPEEKSHWQNMINADGQIVHQSHLLQSSTRSRSGIPGAS